LCSDPKNLELATLKSELRKLEYKIRLIGKPAKRITNLKLLFLEKRFEAAVEACTTFCALVKEEQPNVTEQPSEICYLSEQLSSLNERRRRCLGLADIRRVCSAQQKPFYRPNHLQLKVQQFIQLLTCEKDAKQVRYG
jgi:hypothetical protein